MLNYLEQDIGNINKMDTLVDDLWNEICLINNSRDEEKEELEKQLKSVETKIANITKAVEAGMDVRHLVEEFNKLGDQREHLKRKLAERTSPFAGLTKKMVAEAVRQKKNLRIDRSNPEECKKIIAENILSATILPHGLSIVLKIQLPGAFNHGVGGGT